MHFPLLDILKRPKLNQSTYREIELECGRLEQIRVDRSGRLDLDDSFELRCWNRAGIWGMLSCATR
jgi:hypothetical protein